MPETTSKPIDEAKKEAFVDRVAGVLNNGALSLMLSVGHRTRLFDTLAAMPGSTSEEIAQRGALSERYVREWLGAMVTGHIVEFDPQAGTYRLPPEHAAALTRDASPDNLAVTAQWIPVLAQVEDAIVECFRKGGGVPYTAFKRFHQTMAEESGQTVVAALMNHVLPAVPGVVQSLTDGISVLDVGCGAGRAINRMATEFPRSRFAGFDFSDEAIGLARDQAKQLGLSNARFEVRDVSNIGEMETYDFVTAFDTVHDQAQPAKVLSEIANALPPKGCLLMQDIRASSHLEKNLDHSLGSFLYTISCMHCMTVSLAQGGAGLGTVWGEELAVQMLKKAGFANVEVKQLEHDVLNNYYIAAKT